MEEPKIGVFICHCGTNIAGTVDIDEVRDFVSGLPGVVSARDYKFTCSEPGQQQIKDDVDRYRYQDGTLYSVHLALRRIPRYKAAAFDPDINRAWVLNLGYETLEDFNRDWADIRQGKAPENPRLNVAVNSMFDPTDAPEGKATGLIRVFAPYRLGSAGSGGWESFKQVYMHRCIRRWQAYCEDFSDVDILEARPYTPLDISQKLTNMVEGDWMVGRIAEDNLLANRPSQSLSQYRTPVKGLYLCGSCTHPHGFITFGPGYNALQAIADDYDLEKWWIEI